MLRQLTYLLFTVVSLFEYGYAGDRDSLELQLKRQIPDSVRIDILNKLSLEYKNENTTKAVELANQALTVAVRSHNKKGEARSLHTLGTINYLTAHYPDALHYYLQAVKIREELGDSVNLAKSYNNIALVHFEQNSWDESLKFHQKSIAIKQRRKDEPGLASSFGNVGNIYHRLGTIASEEEQYRKADSLFSIASHYQNNARAIQEKLVLMNTADPGNQISLAATFNNLGNIAYERSILKDNDRALLQESRLNHEKALLIQELYKDPRGLSHSHINLAAIFEKTADYERAIREYQSGLEIAEQLGYHEEKKVIYKGLSGMYEKRGDWKKSLEFYKLFTSEKDTILNIAKQEQITSMQEEFNAKDKEREIQLLSKNQKINQAELEKQRVIRRSFTVGLILAVILIVLAVALLFIMLNRYKLKTQITTKLEAQNTLIVQKNKEITDSIRYAKRIQEALLPPEAQIRKAIPDSFIIYKPKDIVSGDFYWIEEWGKKVLIAVADCTGHGVPGAFMSVVGYNLLNQAVNVYGLDKPSLILNHMNKWLYKILHQNYEDTSVKDGMDIALIAVDRSTMMLEYSGAYNPLWILRDKKLIELKGNKYPVGAFPGDDLKQFSFEQIPLQKGDQLYLFSDGYADQFGGEAGKKFKYKQLRSLIEMNAELSMIEQGDVLSRAFEKWKGSNDQVDDVCMLGVRI
jgi:serine phosphatase RsbU (regulator of sigma subunit)